VAVQIAHGSATKPGQIIKPAAIFNGPVIAHGKFLCPSANIPHDDDRMIVFDDLVPHGRLPHPSASVAAPAPGGCIVDAGARPAGARMFGPQLPSDDDGRERLATA
jgi:hypothetical protein